jgi:hypothetical protein
MCGCQLLLQAEAAAAELQPKEEQLVALQGTLHGQVGDD